MRETLVFRGPVILALATFAGLAAGCMGGVPKKPANVAPGAPHVGWVIMHGDSDNPDREFACQSDPRNDCVVPVSQPDSRVFTDVHFYYHGGGPPTTFTGTVKIGFLEAASKSTEFEVNATAEKEGAVARQSIIGIVASKPGMYEVTIDVTATVGKGGAPQAVRQTIAIAVQ
jgi:hypothetical protein